MSKEKLIGNPDLLQRVHTAFLCSHQVPYSAYGSIFAWTDRLTPERDCVICTNTTELEHEVVKELLHRRIPIIVVTSAHEDYNNHLGMRAALSEGRLLIVELKEGKRIGVSQRNDYVVTHAQDLVLGHVRSGGEIARIANSHPQALRLDAQHATQAAESEWSVTHHWTRYEDKILLSAYYQDLSIHHHHQILHRSYSAIGLRIKEITLSEEVVWGLNFEKYIVRLLKVRDRSDLIVSEWRSDKMIDGVVAESAHFPDMVVVQTIEGRRYEYAIECKWRHAFESNGRIRWAKEANIGHYRRFIKEHPMPLFIALGIGGAPDAPNEVYIIPFKAVASCTLSMDTIQPYRKPTGNVTLVFDPYDQQLTSEEAANGIRPKEPSL